MNARNEMVAQDFLQMKINLTGKKQYNKVEYDAVLGIQRKHFLDRRHPAPDFKLIKPPQQSIQRDKVHTLPAQRRGQGQAKYRRTLTTLANLPNS
jgi:hypothetical protein